MDRFIAMALGCSTNKIKARRAPSFEQSGLGQRLLLRVSPAIGNLVETVNAYSVVGGRTFEPVAEVGRMLRVGVTSGIDNQRLAAGSDLYIQHVIMSVPAVAQRTTIEDEKPFVFERNVALAPTAPLNVITGVRKTYVSLFWRQSLRAGSSRIKEVGAREHGCGKLKQVRVISSIAVRESWNPAIRTMAVHGEFAGALQPLVIILREAKTKAVKILACAQIRPDRK